MFIVPEDCTFEIVNSKSGITETDKVKVVKFNRNNKTGLYEKADNGNITYFGGCIYGGKNIENPKNSFRNWWEMSPYKAGNDDNFKSWPSGNMTIATMMMSLPCLLNCLKCKKNYINIIGYCVGLAFVILYGYNRMHMGNHFLSDVCFGILITYLIYCAIDLAFFCDKKENDPTLPH